VTISQNELSYLYDFVYKRSAIVLGADKEYLVESRLGPLARERGFRSIEELIGAVRSQPTQGLSTMVVEALTTNETTFFRDQIPFDVLRREMVPALKRSRAASRALVIWSAACSTGQEAYSIAMILKEDFPELDSWAVRIIGLDLNERVLARAREGVYHASEISRGLPAGLLAKYFIQIGSDWQLQKVIRDRVEFRQMNLVEPWPTLPRADVLFLRNVLIYFDVATKKAILDRARQAMAPDGYLLLGGAETTLNVNESFERLHLDKCVAYRPIARPAK
jgi:chemotaxis protein methyltransferase CheR